MGKLAGMLVSSLFQFFSFPRVPSKSNVEQVGGHPKILIGTFNPPDTSPWLETPGVERSPRCRAFLLYKMGFYNEHTRNTKHVVMCR